MNYSEDALVSKFPQSQSQTQTQTQSEQNFHKGLKITVSSLDITAEEKVTWHFDSILIERLLDLSPY